jgi:hypothetical protein
VSELFSDSEQRGNIRLQCTRAKCEAGLAVKNGNSVKGIFAPSAHGTAYRLNRGVTQPLASEERLISVASAIALIAVFSCSAYAAEIPCRDLATAGTNELLATMDRKSVQYGGGVQIGDYDCHSGDGFEYSINPRRISKQPDGCDWRTTLRDDRMLDDDYRLVYLLSSHLSGSGSWGDLLVFGCGSGTVKKVYLGQFGYFRSGWSSSVFDSAPPDIRSTLEEYMRHPPIHDLPVNRPRDNR